MILFPDKMYPALSFKCMISSPGMNANKLPYMELTKLSIRNSFDHQTVLCIKTSAICSIGYACSNHIIFRRNFGCKTLQRLSVGQSIQSIYFCDVHLRSKQSYIILLAQQDTFLMVTRLHTSM